MGSLERFLHLYLTTADLDRLEGSLRRQRTFERQTRELTKTRLARLEADLARVALLARTLADLSLAKGLVTREELAQHMLAGESKLAEPEPIVPLPVRRTRSRKRRR